MKTVHAVSLTLILAFALVAPLSAAPAGHLVLRLHDSQGHAYTHRAPVDASRYSDGSTPSPTELASALTAAKSRMADELGYTRELHGPDHYKVLGAVRVVGAWIEVGSRKDPLGWFRGEPERGE